jgi:hypothetical protein
MERTQEKMEGMRMSEGNVKAKANSNESRHTLTNLKVSLASSPSFFCFLLLRGDFFAFTHYGRFRSIRCHEAPFYKTKHTHNHTHPSTLHATCSRIKVSPFMWSLLIYI